MKRHLSDWLEYYLKHTQHTEPPTQYHLWSGITAIASCLQRKCWLNWGLQGNIYPNLYVVMVGPPGGRKGTAMKMAKKLVQKVEVHMGSDALGSIQALYQEIESAKNNFKTCDGRIEEHKSLSVWSEEFQVFLSDSAPGLIANITDLFDCPDEWKYSTRSRGLENLSNCWLTLFGAITPSLLQNKLSQDAVGGGLISRVIFVVGYGKKKKVALAFQSAEEAEVERHLLHDMEQIKNLAGGFRPTEKYIETYVKWYEGPAATAGVDSDKFVGYNERRALHVRKISMVISASESNDMILREHHFTKAIEVLKFTEHDMPNAFYGLGRGVHSDILSDLMRFLQDKGTEQGHISWIDVLRRFQLDAIPSELETYLSICEQTGMIKKVRSAAGKRVYELTNVDTMVNNSEYLNKTVFSKMDQ
jgi:hypothetical protein